MFVWIFSAIETILQQDGRLSPTNSAHCHFGKDASLKYRRVFFSKFSFSSPYFLIFSTLKNFWFSAKKNPQIRWRDNFNKKYHLLRILQEYYHFRRFWKNSRFFEKKHLFFHKKNCERFEKSYCFSRILRQVYFNLVKKNHVQNRERTSFNARERNWQTSGKKRNHLSGWFCFHIYKYGKYGPNRNSNTKISSSKAVILSLVYVSWKKNSLSSSNKLSLGHVYNYSIFTLSDTAQFAKNSKQHFF